MKQISGSNISKNYFSQLNIWTFGTPQMIVQIVPGYLSLEILIISWKGMLNFVETVRKNWIQIPLTIPVLHGVFLM